METDDVHRFKVTMRPPRFMCETTAERFSESRKERQREAWKEWAAPLQADRASALAAYERLQGVETRLAERYEEASRQHRRAQAWGHMLRTFRTLLWQKAEPYSLEDKIREAFEAERAEADPADIGFGGLAEALSMDLHREGFAPSELPEGVTMTVHVDGSPWTWTAEAGQPPELELATSDEDLERLGLDPGQLDIPPRRCFSGDATWGEAVQELTRSKREVVKRRKRHGRTASLAKFRGAVLQNVLYQYELFGKVPAELSDAELTEAERQTEAPTSNPFEDTTAAYDHVQRIIDAYDVGIESRRSMKKMKHLRRELGDKAGNAMRAARNLIGRSEHDYEKRNLFSFVTTLQEIVAEYNEDS